MGDVVDKTGSSDQLEHRFRSVNRYVQEYTRYTHDMLGAASSEETRKLMEWTNQMELDDKSIRDREVFIDQYLKQQRRSAEKLYNDEFLGKLSEARRHSPPFISERSYHEWIGRFKNRNVYYKIKEHFVRKKFPDYLKNWKEVALARDELKKNPLLKGLTSADVGNVHTFLDDQAFLNLSYKKRVAIVSAVSGALHARRKQMPQLHAKAKSILEAAASSQALSWSKVGTWLERIFKSGAKPEQIEQFLTNRGPMPLQKLIVHWTDASKRFQKLEAKRRALGTPRSFHFVSMNVFLNWGYEQRKAYLNEAEHRFTDIRDEPSMFLKIRHALDTQDWDEAEELIDDVKRDLREGSLLMGEQARNKLKSMENFLARHRKTPGQPAGAPKQKPGPAELHAEMASMLEVIPPGLREMYEDALAGGYQEFWSFTVLMYNRVWCHRHGYYDEQKEEVMEQQSRDPTRRRVDQGHGRRGLEWNVVTGDTRCKDAIRDQDGVHAAQVMTVQPTDAESRAALHEKNKRNCNNRNWWYWSSIVPKGIRYPEHLYIVQALHPRMKKIARQMEQMGIRYRRHGRDGAMLHAGAGGRAYAAKPSMN